MPKILHFVTTGAHNYFLYPLIDYRDKGRYEIVVGTLFARGAMHDDLEARGLRTFALDCTKWSQYLPAALRLAWLIRREKIDIVQTHLFDACCVGLLASRLSGRSVGLFTGHHPHESLLQYRVNGKWLALFVDMVNCRWLAHRAVALSEHLRDVLVNWARVPERKVVVLPNGFRLLPNTA
jgi:hypothetical protein